MTQDRQPASRGRIALLGVPVEVGASRRGPLMGPAALRVAGLPERLSDLGFAVEDRGDLRPYEVSRQAGPEPEKARFFADIQAWVREISREAHAMAASGAVPIFLGGDHTLSMGSVNGVALHWRQQGRDLFVLWLDAHADFNTPETSPTGNMHGMSSAFLCGEAGLDDLLGGEPRVPVVPERFHLVGIRSVDRIERAVLRERGVPMTDMRRIDEDGIAAPIRRLLEQVAAANGVLHVSFDLDFLDPALAPGVGTDVPGGATYREAHLVMEMLFDSGLVGSVDVVELNPYLDDRGRTARLAVELIASLFGQQITGSTGPLSRSS